MQNFRQFIYLLLVVIFVIAVGWVVQANYSWIFSKSVSGEVTSVAHVNTNVAIIQGGQSDAILSFAVVVRDEKGIYYNASSNDRRWAAVKPGICADVVFYPFPPWDLANAGTYSNARLIQMRDCPPDFPRAPQPASTPASPPAGTPAQ